jgi:hypothetical protein
MAWKRPVCHLEHGFPKNDGHFGMIPRWQISENPFPKSFVSLNGNKSII